MHRNANQANGANAYGGGIYVLNSAVTVQNSTVNGNKANGTVLGEGGGKKHRAKGELALTTDEGNPLVRFWLVDGKMRRYDCIHSAWTRLAEKLEMKKIRLGMKHLRKTSATLLGQHPQYKFFANHFLADSPRTVADRHYVVPSDAEFFMALDWLRGQILGTESSKVPA